ncbi:lactadherin-like [Argopecten irradians]|uniref:lactadherin-like n=1 Tax=Argopecten irradians TaxID=31199 RepID=UPI00371CCD13
MAWHIGIIFIFSIILSAIDGSPGNVLQLDYPDVTIAAQKNGTFLGQSGLNGDIYIQPNKTNFGTVFFDGYDLLEIIDIINNMPPLWRLHGHTGYSGTFEGGSDINIPLEVLDPESQDVRFELVAGNFPIGLKIAKNPWRIEGIVPDEDAIFTFTIRALDSSDKYADAVFKIETLEVDQCLREMCHNNGQCNNTNTHRGFTCTCPTGYGGPTCDISCTRTALGVGNASVVPDAQMSAYLSRYLSKAENGRLSRSGNNWCGENANSWLQVDLGRKAQIYRIETAGANSTFYTKTYTLSYSTTGTSFDFVNSVNSTTVHTFHGSIGAEYQTLPEPLEARFIRIHPKTYDSRYHPCLQVEMFGCWL